MLDRDGDGFVDIEDVKDMLGQLGRQIKSQCALQAILIARLIGETPSVHTLANYFPQTRGTGAGAMNLSSYLNGISSLLAPMSTPDELSAAFAALDDDDSGQIDVQSLRRAILQGEMDEDMPYSGTGSMTEAQLDSVIRDFVGRRAFGRSAMGGNAGSGRGDVFRWKEFVGAVSGSGKDERRGRNDDAAVAAC